MFTLLIFKRKIDKIILITEAVSEVNDGTKICPQAIKQALKVCINGSVKTDSEAILAIFIATNVSS